MRLGWSLKYPGTQKRNEVSYILGLVVAGGDGGVPLGGALRPVDLQSVAQQHWRGRDEDVLTVLQLGPLPDAPLARDAQIQTGNGRIPSLKDTNSFSPVALWQYVRKWQLCSRNFYATNRVVTIYAARFVVK